ncbi:DUF3238 domain-containing protein [Sporosarcina sp. GW1-11]|uniref:DUF3238 domain-containing protein n=1 Tax=Sporosarcina sp. GW1-11 TaxID=2899126 RepID=UPI00294D1605|nr:DUF3238 domain-containing protein [Sporosarcina sp. GW1-11]MDV6377308.1 DUF3238 domain-containing protein [Sporosarcina sp. GW1-11]
MEDLFEIQRMTHSLGELFFAWTDSGEYYRVYKNKQQVYEGTAAKLTDGELDTRQPFQYTIERVDGGQVKDVIVIQTSALTEVKEDEHPLQRLVITVIVASSQIALSWERIKGVETFDIYRDGKFLQTVEDNRFIDREMDVSDSVTYSVTATRPLIDSNRKLNVSKSIAATLFEAVIPSSTNNKPTEEIYTFTVRVNRRDQLLRPVTDHKKAKEVARWKFRYATFLKEDIIKNPNFMSPFPYFTGDDRNFDVQSERFRTRVDMQGEFTAGKSSLTYTKATGPTIGLNYVKRYKRHDHASVDDIVIERLDAKPTDIRFTISHDVGNPLTASPPIHYEVTGRLDQEGNIDLVGYHNISPHHEIYLSLDDQEWQTVHLAESEGLAYLSGVPGNNYWRYMTCD